MTEALNAKGLEAAHVAYERYGQLGDLKSQRMSAGCMEAVVSAYLSAVPDGEGELVEEVAWALATELGRQDRGEPFNLDENLEIAYLDQGKVSFKGLAKAALAASRLSQAGVRVTDEMVEAGCAQLHRAWMQLPDYDAPGKATLRSEFRAALEAALSTKTTGGE